MHSPRLCTPPRLVRSAIARQNSFRGLQYRPGHLRSRCYASSSRNLQAPDSSTSPSDPTQSQAQPSSTSPSSSSTSRDDAPSNNPSMPPGWEDSMNENISAFSELPHKHFGFNQHMVINAEFKEALRQVLWQFRAPIRYAFAYGSGVFPQSRTPPAVMDPSPHPNPPEAITKWQKHGGKTIDFIFGVSFTQHWHSLNITQHRDHYSFLGALGSGMVSRIQDNFGAGAYFNPYITVNGLMIKYGVVNLDTIYRDLSQWDTLYLAGRLHKPVKILRDDPRIRLANQVNLLSAVRTALLMLPETFTEKELYGKIAGLSYMGDLRTTVNAEDPKKVSNIVDAQMNNFRHLYYPLIDSLPNVAFNDHHTTQPGWMDSNDINCQMQQDMDPDRRGNMVRRLPKTFRAKIYRRYREAYPGNSVDFEAMLNEAADDDPLTVRSGGDFEQLIASKDDLRASVARSVRETVRWPTVTQTVKGLLTAGPARGWKYVSEKRKKGKKKDNAATATSDAQSDTSSVASDARSDATTETKAEAKTDSKAKDAQ